MSTDDKPGGMGSQPNFVSFRAMAGGPALEFIDDGISGGTLDRPGLERLPEAA